jgi:hypothetical protein
LGANAAAEHDASAGIFSVPSRPTLDTLRPALPRLALDTLPAFARLSLWAIFAGLSLITLGADNRITLRPTYAAQSTGAANSDTLRAIVSLRADYRLPLGADAAFYGLSLGAGDCLAGESLRPILSRGANDRIANIALWPRLTPDRLSLRPDAASGSGDALSLRADWPTNGCTLRPSDTDTVFPLGARQSTQTPDARSHRLIAGVEDYVSIFPFDFQPQAVDLDEALASLDAGEVQRTEDL